MIEDPGAAPEKKKVDTESDKEEEVVDDAQLEDCLSQPKPEVEQPKPQSQQEQPKSQGKQDSPKSQNDQQQPNSQ